MNPIDPMAMVPADGFAMAHEADEQAREQDAQARLDEAADCKRWLKTIKDARDFDKHARAGYAKDRTYCRGEANCDVFDVSVNIAGTYVDILTAFLYARDPDTDVLPAPSCGPARIEQARMLGKTLEIVISSLWRKGKLKLSADDLVRSGLTAGIGWLKSTWHNRTERDPLVEKQIADIQDNLQRVAMIEHELAEGNAENPELLRAEYEQQMIGLEGRVEVVLSRGMFFDFVRPEDIQVSTEVSSLKHYLSSPWIAHRTFMLASDAEAELPLIADCVKNATQYFQAKQDNRPRPFNPLDEISADDAETFKSGTGNTNTALAHICIWEVWNIKTNTVLTFCEGLDRYAREPYAPGQATTRFYPFFQWAPVWVDGDRHPHSLIARSRSLLDEYNRIRTNYREHRRRAIPKLAFDAGGMEPDEVKKLEGAGVNEMVGINSNGGSLKDALVPVQYNQIDPALYDTAVIRAELEMIWGIQEALSSTIRTAKTATEAEIQQHGTESRTGYMRDSLESMFTELAQYTAEVALQELPHDDVVVLAGPEAFWPESMGVDDLQTLVNVEIRAGSSGKPNTSARQQQWAAILPQLTQAVLQIGQMRGSSPIDISNSLEQLVVETLDRTGERIDPERFIPPAPAPQPMMPGMPAGMPPSAAMPPEAQGMPPEMQQPPMPQQQQIPAPLLTA
ncbi:hypothetical protein NG831_06500 [Xanthomonas sacchari]|uniref:hypothetical protein n=1 Tax=Xanthomonas sacchari TaxID=56458 RepID=UPI002254814B|nr:hypothetical protein [Xanthomonas sacchari]MCW0413489.1 hypothetical protein [Xanthomonas sacchari]UYK67810.1 hypothetical protein NG831_06500 [Xanthomonas sacchari]